MNLLQLPRLPLDTSTFWRLRGKKYLYVDKTKHAYNLIMNGHRYFLSRPRRFGKSLFVSMLKEILDGNRDLFDDLWITNSDYKWEKFGVIKLDFSRFEIDTTQAFKNDLCHAFKKIAHDYALDIKVSESSPGLALQAVANELYIRFGRVAVLIDEYDSPILKLIHNVSQAELMRDIIRNFFTTIKSFDEYIEFVFITGVSSFAKAGLFSGMNDLRIITLNEKYADICGYTDQEIEYYLDGFVQNWAVEKKIPYETLRQNIKSWYNGYHFGDNVVAVYNPYSLMNALEAQMFDNYWIQSGTPTFLIEELKKEYRKKEFQIIEPEKFKATKDFLGEFDIGITPLQSLMFQTGYLTITMYDDKSGLYMLDYPNKEVKIAFQQYLLTVLTRLDYTYTKNIPLELKFALNDNNIEQAILLLRQLFVHVPYQLHMKEEKFYHALLQIICSVSGIKAQSEYSTSHGRIDLVLDLPNFMYIIEIKFNVSAQMALEQINERRYYESFINLGKPIILLGIAFKRDPKNFDIEYAIQPL